MQYCNVGDEQGAIRQNEGTTGKRTGTIGGLGEGGKEEGAGGLEDKENNSKF